MLKNKLSRLSRTPKVMPTLDWKPEANDVIIPLMGPSGAGKSTFINFVAGKEVTAIGHDLKSCTGKVIPIVIRDSLRSDLLKDRRLVLVDTPGFGDTYVSDTDILNQIGSWLETMYDSGGTKLAGIVYLHEISLTRMLESTSKCLDVFQKLCGKDALKRVVLCTTKWSDIYEKDGERRIEQLKENHWKEMIMGGSTVHKFEDSQKSAWDVIAPIIEADRIGKMDALQIQEELVEAEKLIPDTEAGRQLRYRLDELLNILKQASSKDPSRRKELDVRIAAIRDQMRATRIPVIQRISRLLDKILDKFMLMNATPPSPSTGNKLLVPAVGARLEADIKELIMLLDESENSYERLLTLSDAKITNFGSDTRATTEVRCWSVKREDSKPLFVVTAPSFDSHQGGGNPAIFENVRTWLGSSCREDMLFGIIFLRSSIHPSPSESSYAGRALELIEQSGLKSKTFFALFASKQSRLASKTVVATLGSEQTSTVERPHAGPVLVSVEPSKTIIATLGSEQTGTVERSEPFHTKPALESVEQSKTVVVTLGSEQIGTVERSHAGPALWSVEQTKTVVATLGSEQTGTFEGPEPSQAGPELESVEQTKTVVATMGSAPTGTVERSEPYHAGPAWESVEPSKTIVATLGSEETGTVERSERSHTGSTLESVEQSKTVVATLGREQIGTAERSHAGPALGSVEQSRAVFATLGSEQTGTVERSEPSHAGPALKSVEQSGLESKTVDATFSSEVTGTVERSEPSHARPALKSVELSGLESKTVDATFPSEVTSTVEYGFDGSVACFEETRGQALKMFDIALRNPVGLDLLLKELQAISDGTANRKGKGLKELQSISEGAINRNGMGFPSLFRSGLTLIVH